MLQPIVISVLPLPDYRLLVEYETGEHKIFDCITFLSENTLNIHIKESYAVQFNDEVLSFVPSA